MKRSFLDDDARRTSIMFEWEHVQHQNDEAAVKKSLKEKFSFEDSLEWAEGERGAIKVIMKTVGASWIVTFSSFVKNARNIS
jgi:hypothetical protein